MSQSRLKIEVARAALSEVDSGMVLGVGTGSTVNAFLDELAGSDIQLKGAVSSSRATTEKLAETGIEVMDLNHVGELELYIDGADEVDEHRRLIKGGGGALTREKIIASASRRFVCIVDESKCVKVLGDFPLPVEVVPMARAFVGRKLVGLGGRPELRDGFETDNGNLILDVHGLSISEPSALESEIDHIAGVVTNGLFARRGADELLLATPSGVQHLSRKPA